jgi:hypothetical protein
MRRSTPTTAPLPGDRANVPLRRESNGGRTSPALLSRVDFYQVAVCAIVVLGIALRIRQYLYNRSLWLDESLLTLNLLDKSFTGLFGGLSFNQAAPPGFLLVERLDVDLFGKSEYALRLFPLACGIGSILLFARFTSRLLPRTAALIALTLFSVADTLVYYSSEVKQYSTDVAVTLLIMVMALDLRTPNLSRRRVVGLAAAGSVAVWFSHPAVFAVGAVAVVFLVSAVAGRNRTGVSAQSVVVGTWVISLVIALVYEHSTVSNTLNSFTGGTHAVVPGQSGETTFATGTTFVRNVGGALFGVLGVGSRGWDQVARYAMIVLALLGAAVIALRSLATLGLLAIPAVALAAASALHVYPVLTRTILFLFPYFVTLLAAGFVAMGRAVSDRPNVVMFVLAALVLAVPVTTAANHLVSPRQHEETRAVLGDLLSRWHRGDSIYVFYRAQYPLRYYLDCHCFRRRDVREVASLFTRLGKPGRAQYAPTLRSRSNRAVVDRPSATLGEYLERLRPLAGRKRVWVLATAADSVQDSIISYLSCVGTRKDAFVRDDGIRPFNFAATYLYDLSSWSSAAGRRCDSRFGL